MECRDFVAKDHKLLCAEGARCPLVEPPDVNLHHCLEPAPILGVRRLRPLPGNHINHESLSSGTTDPDLRHRFLREGRSEVRPAVGRPETRR